MNVNFSNQVQAAFPLMRGEAIRLSSEKIGTEHILLAIMAQEDSKAAKAISKLGSNSIQIKLALENAVRNTGKPDAMGKVALTEQAEKALKEALVEADLYESNAIDTEHLLLSILRLDDASGEQILKRHGVTYESVRKEIS